MSDRRIDTPFEKLDSEARKVLYERHDRIKKELRANLATVLGISASVITLSLTVFEKVAPKNLFGGFLAGAWIALGLAALTALGALVGTTMASIKHQDRLADLYSKGKVKLFFHRGAGTPGGNFFDVTTESFPGELGTRVATWLCVLGVVFAVSFAVLNLIYK